MDLTLVRHAAAEPRSGDDAGADAARALTREGRRRFRRVRTGLARLDLSFDRMFHSPLVRAVQTAELLEPLVTGPVHAEPLLAAAPGAALLARLKGERPVLVGHEPWLGELLALLVLGDASHGGAFLWKKGGAALLTGDPTPGGMRLVGFLAPGVLRCVARR
jgi:phosphohistidine phosphatase